MDFTIRVRAEGEQETRALADAVKSFRSEIAEAQKETLLRVKAGEAPGASAGKLAGVPGTPAAPKAPKSEKPPVDDATRKAAEEEKARVAREKEAAKKEAADRKAAADAKRKAREEERAEAEKIDPEMKKSLVDKARERVKKREEAAAKKSEQEKTKAASDAEKKVKEKDKGRAEKIDPSKKMSETQKTVNDKFYKPLMIGAALVGGAIVGAMSKFAPLAIGAQGMARLSMVSAQASFNLRRLFMGTNPKPLLDAIQRTGQLLDPRTFAGDKLGGLLRRVSDVVMATLAKAEPYVRAFFKGMILGGMQAEVAFLKLRVAIQPALNLLPKGTSGMLALSAGALLVKGSLALASIGMTVATYKALAMAATFVRAGIAAGTDLAMGALRGAAGVLSMARSFAAANPAIVIGAVAIGAWVVALKQAKDLLDTWDENSLEQIKNKLSVDLGFTKAKEGSNDAMAKRSGITTGDDYDKKYGLGKYAKPSETPAPATKTAQGIAPASGAKVGTALADGIVAGMKAGEAKVEAGGASLALAAEKGAKAAAEIRSPSRKWKREIAGNMVAGAEAGFEAGAARLADAAGAIMPGAPGVVGAGRSGVVIQQIGPFYGMPSGGEAQVRRWVFDAVDDAAERLAAAVGVT